MPDPARLLATGRTLVGATLVAAPGPAITAWTGGPATTAARVAARGLGARDVVLGVGALAALSRVGSARPWLKGAAAADAADFVATLAAFDDLPRGRRVLWLVTAGTAAVVGLRVAALSD
jgi:hypothetical protein